MTTRSDRASLFFPALVAAVLPCACSNNDPGASAADAGVADAAAAPPSISQGVFIALQGVPSPQPSNPTPFVLVGCPKAGRVQAGFYVLADDGTKTDAGTRVARYTKDGIVSRIEILDAGASSIEVTEKDSFSVAPFTYAATVTLDPVVLDTNGHTFVARMLNPDEPDLNDLGIYFSETLVECGANN